MRKPTRYDASTPHPPPPPPSFKPKSSKTQALIQPRIKLSTRQDLHPRGERGERGVKSSLEPAGYVVFGSTAARVYDAR